MGVSELNEKYKLVERVEKRIVAEQAKIDAQHIDPTSEDLPQYEKSKQKIQELTQIKWNGGPPPKAQKNPEIEELHY